MPGGKNPSPTAVPDTTPKLQDSSLQQGDVAMLQEGQQMMKQSQKPAANAAPSSPATRPPANVETPDAIEFMGSRAGSSLDPNTIGEASHDADVARFRPLMEELARDPSASGPITTQLLSQFANMNAQPGTIGVDIIDMNAAEDAVALSLS